MNGRRKPRIEALVVNAIRKLQDAQGLTPREISNYITQEYDVPGTEIRKQVQLALKRGVSYGILRKSKGGYYTCNQDFLKRQPMDRHDINEMSCPPRRCPRRKRRSSRRRCRSMRRSCRRARRRSACRRRRARRRSSCRKRNRCRRRRRSSGRRCDNSEINEMEAISKQPRSSNRDYDDNNSRNDSISDRSSLTDPDGSMQDPRSITPPITHMD